MKTEYYVREDGRTVEKTTQKVVWTKELQRDFMCFHGEASNEELKTFDESEFVESEGLEVIREKVLPTPEELEIMARENAEWEMKAERWKDAHFGPGEELTWGDLHYDHSNDFRFGPGD